MPGVTTAYQNGVHGSRPANGAGCILYSCTTHGLVYRDDGTSWTTFLTLPSGAAAHAADHEDGGSDEIDVTGLVGAGGGGGLNQAYVGYNAIGATAEATTNNRTLAKKVTLAQDCLLTNIEAYLDNGSPASGQVRTIGAAVYTDASGTPDSVIAHSYSANNLHMQDAAGTALRWLGVPLGIWLPAGDYWLAVWTGDNMRMFYDAGGADRHYNSGASWFGDWGAYSPTTTTRDYSFRGNTVW